MMTLDLRTEQTDLEDTPEQALQAALVALSQEIAFLRAQEAHLAAHERLAWEIALLSALYRQETLSAELLLWQMDQLEQCWTAERVRCVAPGRQARISGVPEQRGDWL